MKFRFSHSSKTKLATVHPMLQQLVYKALELSEIDFAVTSGKRTEEQQRHLVKQGASQTMKSKHLSGRAVDLVPYENGKLNPHDWKNFYLVAEAVQKAAIELNINVRWGGCWSFINDKTGTPEDWVKAYTTYRKNLGKSAFLDGAHFDLG